MFAARGNRPTWLNPGSTTLTIHPKFALLASIASGSMAFAAHAETPAPTKNPAQAESPTGLGEVVVTARRRAENVQNVPVAVTAISGRTLIRDSIFSIATLTQHVPALTIGTGGSNGRATPSFAIRGQRQQDALPSVDGSVGIYFGDIVAARTVGVDQTLYDISSVEVLKGPQGTLFGRNTTGGAIVIKPNLPTNDFSADLLGTVGNYDAGQIQGEVNLPIGDKAALRVAAQHIQHDGYITDVTIGKNDLQDENASSVRASLRLSPIEHLESDTIVDYFQRKAGGTGYELIAAEPSGTQASAIFGPYLQGVLAQQKARPLSQSAPGSKPFIDADTFSAQNTTFYTVPGTQLGDITFKNIIGYRHTRVSANEDFDGSPLELLSYSTGTHGEQFSEELQISGQTKSTNWIVGIYDFNESVFYSNLAHILEPALIGIASPQYVAETDNNDSIAGYAQITQRLDSILNGLSLTGGIRYSSDGKAAQFGTQANFGVPAGTPTYFPAPPISNPDPSSPTGYSSIGQYCSFVPATYAVYAVNNCMINVSKRFSAVTYNVDAEYKFSPSKMVYFSTQRGYRSGGINTRITDPVSFNPIFAPETVQNYEVGAKLDFSFSGMLLRANLAAYHQDYSNIQRLVQVNTIGGGVATNVVNAFAHINGGELEVTFIPVQNLELTASTAQVYGDYTSFKYINPASGATVDLTNTPLAGTPSQTYTFQGRYTAALPNGMGEAAFQAFYYWQGPTYWQDVYEPQGRIASYGVADLRLEWNRVFGHPLDMALFVNNVADNHYYMTSLTLQQQIGFTSAVPGAPRTIGFQIHYHWGGR